jgi:acetyl-CoA synthetase
MTPTALKRLAEISAPKERWPLKLRVVCTGGESLPSAVVRWAKDEIGIVCNEFYGLTEFNHMIGNCEALYPVVPGSMGRSLPGRTVAIIDEEGHKQKDGIVGEIASWYSDDPSLFLGYWRQPKATKAVHKGDWLRSGDLALRDKEGYFWYQGRNDDLIKSAGYRIGPAEVEDTLIRHPMVAEAAVVGQPNEQRGQIVVAFVRLTMHATPTNKLKKELQDYVKFNLAYYKYPREIHFVKSFPMTSSGKIRRNALREQLDSH